MILTGVSILIRIRHVDFKLLGHARRYLISFPVLTYFKWLSGRIDIHSSFVKVPVVATLKMISSSKNHESGDSGAAIGSTGSSPAGSPVSSKSESVKDTSMDGLDTPNCSNQLRDVRMPMFGEGDFGKSFHEKGMKSSRFTSSGNQSHEKRNEARGLKQEYLGQQGDGRHFRDHESKSLAKRTTSNDEPKPNIIVNYLPQNLSDKEFFHLFAPYGEMESIKIMRDSQTGYSFGYGFVNYIDLQDAIDARNALNGTQLGHKRIKVSFARPPSDDIKDTNLFVTGLPSTITEAELDQMFSRFGVIVHLRVLRDRQTKATRGVAFVRYETRNEACTAILEMNAVVPKGGTEGIRVRLAQDHGKQKAAYLAGYQAALKMKGPDLGGAGTRVADAPFRQSETSFELRPRNVVNRGRPMTACVGDGIRVTTSSSDPTLYWKGFLHGAREPRRPETSGGRNSDHRANSRSRY